MIETFKDAIKFKEAKDTLGRKSVPIDWFRDNCILMDNDMDFIKYIN